MLLFAGCSDDDDAKFSGDIVGKWQLIREYGVDEEFGEYEHPADDLPNCRFYLIFKSDGTMNEIEEEDGIIVTNNPYSWELSGNKLIMTDEYGTEWGTVKQLTKTNLTLYNSDGEYWAASDFVRVSE